MSRLAERLAKLARVHRYRGSSVALHRKRIYILPTRYGWVYGALVGLMLIGAVNYANNLVFLLSFLLAALGLNAMVQTHRNLAGLTLSLGNIGDRFAGEAGEFPVTIGAGGRPRYGIRLILDLPSPVIDVDAKTPQSLVLRLIGQRRGHHRLPRLRIETRYPLGLFCAWSYLQSDQQAWVYPAPEALLPLPQVLGAGAAPVLGDAPKQARGDSIAGVRDYQQGDSPRRIDWRALARGRGLLTKTTDGAPAAGERWLQWHDAAPLATEQRLSVLAYWLLETRRQQQVAGLRLPGIELAPKQQRQGLEAALRALASYG